MKDVDDFVKTCVVCQSTNGAKFMKTAAPLHPIPIQTSVWHQVSSIVDYTDIHVYRMRTQVILSSIYRLE